LSKETEFQAKGYLKTSRLDREGAKQHTFEFSGKDAVESAKLELMSRDFDAHTPVLLDVTVKRAKDQGLIEGKKNARPRKHAEIIR